MIKKGYYLHFKGNHYLVIDVAKHSETEEELVVYKSMKDESQLWVRPLELFLSPKVLPDGSAVERFKYIGESLSSWTKG